MTKLISVGKRRVDDPSGWIQSFEVECYLNFVLRKNDIAFNKDENNILVQLNEYGDKVRPINATFRHGVSHHEFQHWDWHVMKDEFHCWLYHCLYDHTNLGWSNILRIGAVDLDIQIVYQKYTSIEIE
tara:strand:+ start:302 stop:685 length:384 start_codon:yes stop_codon:yes gene_type:complete